MKWLCLFMQHKWVHIVDIIGRKNSFKEKEMIDCNTTIKHGTKFLNPTQLISEGIERHGTCSENWPYPAGYKIGDVYDNYYAEVWVNGMDWQNTYWFLEAIGSESPQAVPFLIFSDHKNQDIFHEYDFANLVKVIMLKRKQQQTKTPYEICTEEVFPYLGKIGNIPNKQGMFLYHYSHASQPQVEFHLLDTMLTEAPK